MSLESAQLIRKAREKELREIEAAELRIKKAKLLIGSKSSPQLMTGNTSSFMLLGVSLFLIIIGLIVLVFLLVSFPTTFVKESNDRLSIVIINETKETISQPIIYQNNITEIKERVIQTVIQPQVTQDTIDYANEIIEKYG